MSGEFQRALEDEFAGAVEALQAHYRAELEAWVAMQDWQGLRAFCVPLSLDEISARYPTAGPPASGPEEATEGVSEDVVPPVQGKILSYTNLEWSPGQRTAVVRWSYDSEGTPTDD